MGPICSKNSAGSYGRSASSKKNADSGFVKENSTIGELRMAEQAPKWSATAVVDGEFKKISSDDYKGKYLVFFFYPMDYTFVCPTEILAFSDRAMDFRKINCEVVAASTDSQYCHLAWVSTPKDEGGLGPLKIPLVADKNCQIARKYGIYKEDEGISYRGLFIIDGEQKLRQITINDLPVGRSVDETLRLVQALQYTDKHGEVCPVGWKPGEEAIKTVPPSSIHHPTKKQKIEDPSRVRSMDAITTT